MQLLSHQMLLQMTPEEVETLEMKFQGSVEYYSSTWEWAELKTISNN